MADGDYERRAAREAELKRMARIMRETRGPCAKGVECGKICAPGQTGKDARISK